MKELNVRGEMGRKVIYIIMILIAVFSSCRTLDSGVKTVDCIPLDVYYSIPNKAFENAVLTLNYRSQSYMIKYESRDSGFEIGLFDVHMDTLKLFPDVTIKLDTKTDSVDWRGHLQNGNDRGVKIYIMDCGYLIEYRDSEFYSDYSDKTGEMYNPQRFMKECIFKELNQ